MEGPNFRAVVSYLLGRVGVSAVATWPGGVRGASPAEPAEEKPESLAQISKFYCFLVVVVGSFPQAKAFLLDRYKSSIYCRCDSGQEISSAHRNTSEVFLGTHYDITYKVPCPGWSWKPYLWFLRRICSHLHFQSVDSTGWIQYKCSISWDSRQFLFTKLSFLNILKNYI